MQQPTGYGLLMFRAWPACVWLLLCLAGTSAARPSITRSGSDRMIALDNGVRIEIKLSADGLVRGVGRVWWKDTLVKSDRVLQLPRIKTVAQAHLLPRIVDPLAEDGEGDKTAREGLQPPTFKFVRIEKKRDRVRLLARVAGSGDELVWEFRPHETVINKTAFHGYGYTISLASKRDEIVSITDNPSHAPGGSIDDTWIMEQAWFLSYIYKQMLTAENDLTLRASRDPAFEKYPGLHDLTKPTPMFSYGNYNFRFQYGGRGALFLYSARPTVAFRTIQKAAGSDQILYEHEYLFNRVSHAATPQQVVLFSPELTDPSPLAVEDWHGIVYDFVKARHCAAYDVKPQPLLTLGVPAYSVYSAFDSLYRMREYLKTMHEWGFQGIWFACSWHDGIYNRKLGQILTPLNLRPGANHGGEDIFRDVCEYAHSLDMKVIGWMSTLYMSDHSLLAQQHPEWWMRGEDGMRNKRSWWRSPRWVRQYDNYSSNVFLDSRSPFGDYLLKTCLHLKELGADGFWFDSYPHPLIDDVGYKGPDFPSYQHDRVNEIHASLMKEGLTVLYEGAGALGQSCSGTGAQFLAPDKLLSYQKIYGWQRGFWYPAYLPDDQVDSNYYYQALANKITCTLATGRGPKPIHKTCPPRVAQWIIRANKDYGAVYEYMQYRHQIPSDGDPHKEKAVEWTNDAGRTKVLWAYEQFDYQVVQELSVTDVTADQACAVRDGVIRTEPWHTYVISE